MPNGEDRPGRFIDIQPRELYDTLRRLETKVDLLATNDAKIQDHETRLRALESKFVGVAVSAVVVFLTGAGALIWKAIN